MRNKHPGKCYRCGEHCAAGAGHFERIGNGWRVQHAECAIKYRGTPDPVRQALTLQAMRLKATGTGKKAQRARKWLKDLEGSAPPIRYEDF